MSEKYQKRVAVIPDMNLDTEIFECFVNTVSDFDIIMPYIYTNRDPLYILRLLEVFIERLPDKEKFFPCTKPLASKLWIRDYRFLKIILTTDLFKSPISK